MPRGPADPTARAEWARLRRRAAAAHHPDRGGDVESYLEALAAVDAQFGIRIDPAAAPGSPPTETPLGVRRTWRGSRMRLARRRRRFVRTIRTRLPRPLRGARRTTEI